MTEGLKKKIYKWTYYGLAMFVAMLLETTWLSSFRVYSASPTLVPFVISAIALLEGVEEGVIAGLAGGVLCDAMYSSHDGFFTVMLPILAYLLCLMNTVMYWKNFGMAILDWLVLIFVFHSVHFLVYMFMRGEGSYLAVFRVFFGEAVTTLPFTPFLYLIIKKIVSAYSHITE